MSLIRNTRNSWLRVARTNLTAYSESTQNFGSYKVFWSCWGICGPSYGSVRFGRRRTRAFWADRIGPNRNSARKYPNMTKKPCTAQNFAQIPNMRSDSCGLPAITSYESKRVFLVKPIKSATRANPTEPTQYPNSAQNFQTWPLNSPVYRKRGPMVKYTSFWNRERRNAFFCDCQLKTTD